MKEIYSDILTFRGNHYDFGYMQGELLKDSLTVKNRERQWKLRKPRFNIDIHETKQVITVIAPSVWEELIGIEEALGWGMEDVLQEFGGYRLDYVKSGCSIFTREDYMIRNYDCHPKTYEGRLVLYQPSDKGYATIGPSQRITGRMDGMNQTGLALGYNFIHRKKPGDGFICSMIGRLILETCGGVDEAVNLLEEMPHRHSFSYIVLDPNGEIYIIEATPRGVEVRHSNVCTNHFEVLESENRHHLDDSFRRMTAIEEQKEHATDVYEAYRMLNDCSRDVFSEFYKNWAGTIHTSVYFPRELKV